MSGRLDRKVCIVTGGAHGIGAAIVRRFREEGAQVALADVDRTRGEEQAHRVGASFVEADLSDNAAVESLVAGTVARFGGLDVVVSNACIHRDGTAQDTPPELWDTVMAVNLTPTFYLARAASPHLRRRAGSSFLIIASVQAILGFPAFAAYASAKGGQLALMRQLAVDLAPGVRVNAISPGTINTYPEDMDAETERVWGGMHLLKRLGEPVEVANAAVFLCSDEASFITGHNLVVDGGLSAGRMV